MPPATPPTINPDRHDLYEQCVQSPAQFIPMLRAMQGGEPTSLAEDFAGTAALAYLWADTDSNHHAVAVDVDKPTLMRRPDHPRVTRVVADVRDPALASTTPPCDICFVGNFSIGELHTRAELVAYLASVRARLNPHGLFVCDTYGGESAYLLGEVHRDHLLPDGRRVRYTWEQRDANPLTGMVTNALHFEIDRAGMIELELPDAFVYRWRLWSVPELRDALHEAGFTDITVYDKSPDAQDEDGNVFLLPATGDDDLDDSFIVCVTGRAF